MMAVTYLQDQPSPRVMCYREAQSMPCIGDLTDVFPCGGEGAALVIADVCGNDERAEAHARYLRHAVRALVEDYSPAGVLGRANRVFSRRIADFADDRFASLFVATVRGRRMTYASAGHDFALLIGADGRHQHLPSTGVIVGVSECEHYGEVSLRVAPSDWLVLATDGVTDARDRKGNFFGTSGVARNVHRAIKDGVDDPAAHVLEAARKHAGGRFIDDASVLCVRFS
jgi:sigma-B regulation protein RsbU (phosphoserine phosphatase)